MKSFLIVCNKCGEESNNDLYNNEGFHEFRF